MQTREKFTETGCYFDSHRGHYIERDVIEFAVDLGFIISPSDKLVVDLYEHSLPDGVEYPYEVIHELCTDATDWLNSSATEREIPGQNMPPARPDGYYWGFWEGDFGLYSLTEDERVEDADDEHSVCPDCGNTGTKVTAHGGYVPCVRYLSCWSDS